VAGQHTVQALETIFAPVTTTTVPSQDSAPGATTTSVVQDPDALGSYNSIVTSTSVLDELALPATRPLAPSESIRFYDQREMISLGADGRLTVVLLGSDEGPGRGGVRTDSIIVVSIDPWSLHTAMFSVPRNWAQVPMPPEWPGPDTHDSLSNTIYRYGWDNADVLYPDATDPGAEAIKRVLGDLLQLEIDQYWKVSMAGFVDVVDAVGGVKVNVQLAIDNEYSHPAIPNEWYSVKLNRGVQHLDGLEALAYSRSRRTTSDYNRMARQRCVVAALGQQVSPGDLLFGFDDLLAAFQDHVSTDISLSILPALVDVATLIELDNITTVTFVPPTFVDGTDDQGRWVPHVERVRESVRESLTEADAAPTLIELAGDACG
jgi:LCP family protein required for cell wall assembly